MVKTFDSELNNITREQLSLNNGDLSGDLVSGGLIKDFASTGIKDTATKQSLTVEDDCITVKSIRVETVESNLGVRGNVKIYGDLDVGTLRAFEVTTNLKHEKQYLMFANPDGDVGSGLLWSGDRTSKQFVFRNNPNRFFSTEYLDLANGKAYMADGQEVLTSTSLGNSVTSSNLQNLGTLKKLVVGGNVNIADDVFYNPVSQRFSIGTDEANGKLTVYDYNNDVELIFSSNDKGNGVIGSYNTKGLELVTDNQSRITVEVNGNITLGQEHKDSTVTRVYGKLSVGVKNPTEQFEVAGNIRWANKLFAIGNQAPTTGNYTQGDIIWNSIPKESSYIGWVCVIGGAPGVWKPFGQING